MSFSPTPWRMDEERGHIVDARGETVIDGMGYDGLWTAVCISDADLAFLIVAVNTFGAIASSGSEGSDRQ